MTKKELKDKKNLKLTCQKFNQIKPFRKEKIFFKCDLKAVIHKKRMQVIAKRKQKLKQTRPMKKQTDPNAIN